MADIADLRQNFYDELQALFSQVEHANALFSLRQKAWDAFSAIGLPEKIDYIPLRALYEKRALFNGDNVGKIHSTEVEVLPLEEALVTYGASLKASIARSLQEEKDPFALLNMALHRQGLFIYIPPGSVIKTPLQLTDVSRMHLVVGAGAQVEVVLSSCQEGHAFWDISLNEGASLRITLMDAPYKEAHVFTSIRARLKKNSSLHSIQISRASQVMRRDYRVFLEGEGAAAELHGVTCAHDSASAHGYVWMEHRAPACHSMQNFKALVKDRAHISSEGKIYIHPEAQKTRAYQLNRSFLLSSGARAYVKPNLEIFADDVKASHGATMAKWDEAQLLYLRARGVSENRAKQLILKGFCQDVIGQLNCPSARKEAELLVSESI